MKATLKVMALTTLLAVICLGTYVAVSAAEDIPPATRFANDQEMMEYGETSPDTFGAQTPSAFSEDTPPVSTFSGDDYAFRTYLDDGGVRSSNLENAPALRVNNPVSIPTLTGDEEAGGDENTQQHYNMAGEVTPNTTAGQEAANYPVSPDTGYVSSAPTIAFAALLLLLAAVTRPAKKRIGAR